MRITVRYFASLREKIGKEMEMVELSDSLSIEELWLFMHHESLPKNILTALNQTHVPKTQFIQDGDEVAFFPPITGG